jgi:predicted LPLAT superfamily acyltransferase
MPPKRDAERKRGNRLGLGIFRAAARVFGLRGAYGLLYFVALYYLLADRPAVSASMAYVGRRFGEHGPLRRIFDVYLLFVSQGKSLIDRHHVAAGGTDIGLEFIGSERIAGFLSEGRKGMILLTAHVGDWQVAMTALGDLGRTVHIMMHPEDNAAVKEALNVDGETGAIRIISTSGPLGGVVNALAAIEQGDIVSIMGDRAYGRPSVEASLFGAAARLPFGAFSLAAAAKCPVAVLLSAKVGAKRHVTEVARVISPPARARRGSGELAACVQEYARVLEEYADRHPYQWFVFRDLWREDARSRQSGV